MRNFFGILRYRDEVGSTIVELAISLPLFFVLVFGVIEYSLLFEGRTIVLEALNEATRRASVEGADCQDKAVTFFMQDFDRLNVIGNISLAEVLPPSVVRVDAAGFNIPMLEMTARYESMCLMLCQFTDKVYELKQFAPAEDAECQALAS